MASTKIPLELTAYAPDADGATLELQTTDTTVTDGSVLGKIEFKAPKEASGTDAILVGAAIEAVAEGTFAADNNATELVFKTGASEAATQKMVLTSAGRLGLGTASPSSTAGWGTLLEVSGTTNAGIKFTETDTANGDYSLGVTAGTFRIWDETASAFRVILDGSGNVAIGRTSSIAHPLDIQRADNAYIRVSSGTTQENAGIIFANQNTTKWTLEKEGSAHSLFLKDASSTVVTFAQGGNVLVGKTSTAVGTQGIEFMQNGEAYSTIVNGLNTWHVYANSGYRFYVNPNGGIYNYSANNSNLSDEREKKNIEALESQWDSLKLWSLKKFHYNADDNSENKKYGVIAQEVETHNPEVVSEFEVDDDTTRKAVKEQQMMWLAVKALQEAMTRIETLETKVKTLEDT
jgi:hypothetical protein